MLSSSALVGSVSRPVPLAIGQSLSRPNQYRTVQYSTVLSSYPEPAMLGSEGETTRDWRERELERESARPRTIGDRGEVRGPLDLAKERSD